MLKRCSCIFIPLIILAAGLSERMGVFKPLLPVGDSPAIIRCVKTAEAAGIRDIAIVTGNMRDELEAAVRMGAPGARLVHNAGYHDGMFSSVRAGVAALPDGIDGFFLLPADCCAVSSDTLLKLMDEFTKARSSAVMRTRFEGRRGHPPLIPARYVGPLLAYGGDRGLKGFLSGLPTVELEMDNPGSLLDMDTPGDYAELLTHLGLPAYPAPGSCAELMEKYGASQEIVEHGKQVAALALKIARLMSLSIERREPVSGEIDVALLESSCMLHDIGRTSPRHARVGMEILLREGYPMAAELVGGHMDLPYPAQGGHAPVVSEMELLYLADKLCRRGNVVMPEDTLRALESRFSDNHAAMESARGRMSAARAILDTLQSQYSISFADL